MERIFYGKFYNNENAKLKQSKNDYQAKLFSSGQIPADE
jgi:hypothetical protein